MLEESCLNPNFILNNVICTLSYFLFAIAYFLFIFSMFNFIWFNYFSLTRGWTWLAVLRQCFSSGRATDSHISYKARPSQNSPKYYHVRPRPPDFHINFLYVIIIRRRVLCDQGLITASMDEMAWLIINRYQYYAGYI